MTDHLFHKADLYAVLETQKQKLKDEINGLQADYLLSVSEQDLQAYLLEKYEIAAPVLRPEEASTPGARDTNIDVSGDFRYGVFDRSEPVYVTGTEVTIHIPYTGDRELFFCKPSTFNYSPPRAEVTSEYVALSFRRFANQVWRRTRAQKHTGAPLYTQKLRSCPFCPKKDRPPHAELLRNSDCGFGSFRRKAAFRSHVPAA